MLCPEFATDVFDCYQTPVRKEIQSAEGIYHIAIEMYGTRMFPLLHLNELSKKKKKKKKKKMNGRINCLVFADDFAGAGKLQELRSS